MKLKFKTEPRNRLTIWIFTKWFGLNGFGLMVSWFSSVQVSRFLNGLVWTLEPNRTIADCYFHSWFWFNGFVVQFGFGFKIFKRFGLDTLGPNRTIADCYFHSWAGQDFSRMNVQVYGDNNKGEVCPCLSIPHIKTGQHDS